MHVTQADIARELGVSQATVGLVLGRNSANGRGKSRLRPETIRKIENKSRELGYQPHRHAQAMRQGRSMTIGLLHAGSLLQVSNERAYYATQALKRNDYHLQSADVNHGNSIEDIVQDFLQARVDGVLLASTLVQDVIRPLQRSGIPLVGLSSDVVPGVPLVRCDMKKGIHDLVQHLIQQGCRRLVHVATSSNPNTPFKQWPWQTATQIKGFQSGVVAHDGAWSRASLAEYGAWLDATREGKGISGLSLIATKLQRDPFNPFLPSADLAGQLLSASKDLPDAFLCQNDDWAYGLMNRMLQSKVSIPRRLAVTGFNDSALAREFVIPITSVRQPAREMAEKAVELLINAINGQAPEARIYDFAGQLIARASSSKSSFNSKKTTTF